MLKLIPMLGEIKVKLREIYKDFCKDTKGFIYEIQHKEQMLLNEKASPLKKRDKNQIVNAIPTPSLPIHKCLIYNQNKTEDEKCKKIFEIFKHTFEIFTLKKLPLKPIFFNEFERVH